MTTGYAAPPVAARPDRREQARQDRLVNAEIERAADLARTQARIARDEAAARVKRDAAAARRAARAAARDDRAARLAGLAAWAGGNVVDLLFVPVIAVPALLSWTAMASFGMKLYGIPGAALPAFSEGAMWAFAAAVTLTLRRYPGRPVWHLRAGIAVFAVFGAALNFLHGLAVPTALFPGLPAGYLTGTVMALISVAGVIAHQLITAGPHGRHRDDHQDDEPAAVDEPEPPAADTAPAITADSTPDTAPDSAPAPKRTPARTRRGPSTASRVAAMADKHPDMSAADIAKRLKVSDRTVRRYLTARPQDAPPATAE